MLILAKCVCLFVAMIFTPEIIGGVYHGRSVTGTQIAIVSASIIGFIALQGWL